MKSARRANLPLVTRDEWVAKFASEIQSLRDVWHAGKFVKALAQQEWLAHQHEGPVKVAGGLGQAGKRADQVGAAGRAITATPRRWLRPETTAA